jgi:hypothetical protein
MAFISVLIAAAIILAVGGSTLAASKRVRSYAQLPMQWGFDGKPTWYASQHLTLAFGSIFHSGFTIFILLSSLEKSTSTQAINSAEYHVV